MIVIGIDPSTEGFAYAALSFPERSYVEASSVASLDGLEEILRRFSPLALVAVERPSGLHIHLRRGATPEEAERTIMAARARAVSLQRASYVAGYVAAVARGYGVRVVEMAPDRWRSALGVASRAKDANQDALVKQRIVQMISGWPKRSNDHVRDAAGVALAAAWQDNSRRRPNP